jgi:hypothetical protein
VAAGTVSTPRADLVVALFAGKVILRLSGNLGPIYLTALKIPDLLTMNALDRVLFYQPLRTALDPEVSI